MQCRWFFFFKVIQYLFLLLFFTSYLIQSLLGCPGSRNGKLVDSVSMNASIKTTSADTGNKKGKEGTACKIYNIFVLYDVYLFYLEIACKLCIFIGSN